MAKYLYFALSDCKDPAREADFNEWHSKQHIPDSGMIKTTRWVSAEAKEGQHRKYLALYGLD